MVLASWVAAGGASAELSCCSAALAAVLKRNWKVAAKIAGGEGWVRGLGAALLVGGLVLKTKRNRGPASGQREQNR